MTAPIERLTAALADRYRIERELGQGGMATVYLAEDLKHDRKVAIKVLKPELAAVLGAERFVQEIKTTAALSHPHILPLFDSGEAGGFLYYVMPYIQGETIREKLNRETQFGIEDAARITTEVADALDYAHRHGVIHRDIKPENILLHDGRAMVMDFGIALAVSAAAGGRMTETGLSLGTPHYMSPEQATAEKEISGRSDVYSLASVCYEMLAGQPPHLGGSAQQIIMKIIAEPAPALTTLRKSVPPNVAAAVGKALEKLPADRFETAKAFAQALADPHFKARSTAVGSGTRHATRDWIRDRRTVVLGAVTLAALAGLPWALSRRAAPALGPSSYDVALPDSAPGAITDQQPFAIARDGTFIVYQAQERSGLSLWYRSLIDDVTRRVDGSTDGQRPAISPDGSRVAFLRFRESPKWTLEVVPVAGGASATLAEGVGEANLQWLDDGRLQILEGDGNRLRWVDPGSGTTVSHRIAFCNLPSYLPGRDAFLCGGGQLWGWMMDLRDTTRARGSLWQRSPDSTFVPGSDFHVIDDRYLVYLSIGGDLLAAPVELGTRRVGRSVRLVTGVGRSAFFGAGSFALSASGTLVYAQGVNHAVGHLVATDGATFDTLAVGREAFQLFAASPNRRHIAAVVQGSQGQELRVYDLKTGEPVVIGRSMKIRQPVWSPRGDRVLFAIGDSVFVADPGRSAPPSVVAVAPETFDTYTWESEDRVVGMLWDSYHAVSLDLTKSPVVWDTLAGAASFAAGSPDGRWLVYGDPDLLALWVSPIPTTGRRYQVATGSVAEPRWGTSREIVYGSYDSTASVVRMAMDVSQGVPVFTRRAIVMLPEYVETAGRSYQLMPDGRVVYVRTKRDDPRRFLRVVPNWVARMKRAVDEANR
jgi:tRNA A-37 threonylcarbamoyl transferase component Bud32